MSTLSKQPKPNGVILWQGYSQLDGKTPVVCILTGLTRKSRNGKTGAMLQTYILRADMSPTRAVLDRQDGGICGGCVHRLEPKTGHRTCYVNVWQGPLMVARAFQRGNYPTVDQRALAALVRDRSVRFGAYGDPAAVPVSVWQFLADNAGGYTGYTHQWRSPKFAAFAGLVQASCETMDDVRLARSKGFRGAFLVVPSHASGAVIPRGAVLCPASIEAGKRTTCERCGLCNGKNGALVAIHAHGMQKQFYQLTRKRTSRAA